MKKYGFTLVASTLIALVANAPAAIVFQTQNYSDVNGSAAASGLSLLWNKFDTGLGTLTGVTMAVTGSLTGSFLVQNEDASPVDVYDSEARFRMNFSAGTGAPANITASYVTPLSTSPGSGASPGSSVPANSSQTFTINGPISLYVNSFDYFSQASYFSAAGLQTFSTALFRNVNATVDGSVVALDTTLAVMGGTIDLTYTYTPSSAVPEPGTWAAAALLAGGAVFTRWRKRAKVS